MPSVRSKAGPAGRPPELGPALEFLRTLWALNHGLETQSKRMQSAHGVTGRDRMVLRVIGSVPDASAGAVARMLHVDPSSLTGALRRLVERGFVHRSAHHRDSRRAVLVLTEKGRRVDALRDGTIEARVRRVLDAAPSGETRAAARMLRRLTLAMQG